jgi:hypothetical protein
MPQDGMKPGCSPMLPQEDAIVSPCQAPYDTTVWAFLQGVADSWHTNAVGNALIARSVLEILRQDARVKRYLARIEAQKE